MNKRVFNYVIALLWVILIGFSILKLFFGEWFVAVVDNQRIIYIGNIIDNSKAASILAETILGIVIMHFYLCACKQVWRLTVKEYALIVIYSIAITVLRPYIPKIINTIDLLTPIILPIALKCKWRQTAVIFVLHHIGQLLTIFIRSEELYLVNTNSVTTFVLTLDMYIWLCLYYVYSNIYKEETLWDCLLQCFSAIRQKLSLRKNSKE